ncbi:MAG: PQQ-binding-like beta-propeller repeat protein [Deltaproteobacteria bacterium]|nr:PQQ-binding-like beta-propeller repeat protein [Deltaproteobacteria bacterium]
MPSTLAWGGARMTGSGMARSHARSWLELPVCGVAVLLGCGAHAAPPLTTVPPTSTAPAIEVVSAPTPEPVAPTTAAERALAAPRPLEDGAVIEWPAIAAVSLEEVELPFAVEVWGHVAVDGLPLVVLGGDRLIALPTDGHTPTRAFADERGHSNRCVESCVAVAGGAFVVLDRDGVLVARDIATLATRWERPAPEGIRSGVYGDGDTFVVQAEDGVFGLDAATGAQRWHWEIEGGYAPRIGQGLFVQRVGSVVFAIALSTGEVRFRVEAVGVDLGPVTPDGFALLRARYADAGSDLTARQVRLVGLDGTQHVVELDADIESRDAVLVAAQTLTVLVSAGDDRAEVRRYDARTGRRLQRSRSFGRALPGSLLAVGPDVAIIDRTLGIRLLDGPTLAERWLGGERRMCVAPIVWRPTATSTPVLTCRGYGGFGVYRASAAVEARRPVTVSGVVRCGERGTTAHVMVEGVVAQTDRRGRYRVRVSADEEVNVTVAAETDMLDADCSGSRSVLLPPDAREVRVDFDLAWRNVAEGL